MDPCVQFRSSKGLEKKIDFNYMKIYFYLLSGKNCHLKSDFSHVSDGIERNRD